VEEPVEDPGAPGRRATQSSRTRTDVGRLVLAEEVAESEASEWELQGR